MTGSEKLRNMTVIRITKQFSFEMAHALADYDGLCKNIHGHSYRMDVTVKGEPTTDSHSPKKGMLIDFTDLKKLVNTHIIEDVDHALLLPESTNLELVSVLRKNYEKIRIVPYQPTTENMLADFAQRLRKVLPEGVHLYAVRLRETDSSFAEWFAEDNL